jgi:hypothetical protein
MGTKRTYECNLCHHSLTDAEQAEGHISQGVGIYWLGRDLEIRPAHSVEHHLCLDCIRAVAEVAKKC